MATVMIVETGFNLEGFTSTGASRSVWIEEGSKFYREDGIWCSDIWAKTITSKGVRIRIGTRMIADENMPKYIHYFKSKTKE